MKTTQTASVETISPDEAKWILENRNKQNRPLRELAARNIAKAIATGKWKLNGETIIFGTSGHLLTGQHRLRACVIANMPIVSWVVRGVEDSVFNTVDQGMKKTPSDILSIGGEKHSTIVAAAARWLGVIDAGGITTTARGPTPIETEEIVRRHPSIRRWAARYSSSSPAARRILRSYIVAVLSAASEIYGDAAVDRFFDQIADGIGLEKGSPALLLRERLMEQSVHKRTDTRIMLAMTIKATSAFMHGKNKMSFLRWKPDEAWPTL